jgi:hypothetical protein
VSLFLFGFYLLFGKAAFAVFFQGFWALGRFSLVFFMAGFFFFLLPGYFQVLLLLL